MSRTKGHRRGGRKYYAKADGYNYEHGKDGENRMNKRKKGHKEKNEDLRIKS